ncbi:hypothetical protein AB0O28_02105 [Microbispora sp. NPDC088329]|uniref:hypothetical protein n=1 Tax=Microbispora sp. NPDC088329 TaxID=3154869 RepID=UPI00342E7CB3
MRRTIVSLPDISHLAGAGEGSWLWSTIRGLLPAMRAGLVQMSKPSANTATATEASGALPLIPSPQTKPSPAPSPSTDQVSAAALLTDGAAGAVDRYGLMTRRLLLDVLAQNGPSKLISRVRETERSDPHGERWPRSKAHEHASAVFCLV